MKTSFSVAIAVTVLGLSAQALALNETRLLEQPDISEQHIAFVHGGDIWLANRDGSDPRQLTSHPASETKPLFSPNGQWLAFSADYHGNDDVYVISINGGPAKRLTWHPSHDLVTDWSGDGEKVFFTSNRAALNTRSAQLFSVPVSGGEPQKYMEAVVAEGKFAPDGETLAYRPNRLPNNETAGWRLHRGGSTPPVWLLNKEADKFTELPRANASHHHPFWLNDQLYMLSDRDDVAANLYRYNGQTLEQLTQFSDWDIASANGHGDTIVFAKGGYLYLFKPATGEQQRLQLHLAAPAPQLEPDWVDASSMITQYDLSRTGKRVALTARGDIFSVAVEHGPTRNLTTTDGEREYTAIWHPDGDRIAFIQDDTQQTVVIAPHDGIGEAKRYALPGSSYYNLLAWSPDGQRIALSDNHINLFLFDTESGELEQIHSGERRWDQQVAFSPDGQFIAFNALNAVGFSKVYLFDIGAEKKHALTEGMSFASNPVFSNDFLFFTASVNAGPAVSWLDLSAQERPVRMGIYALSLRNDVPSPVAPRLSDEEAPRADEAGQESEEASAFTIDLEGLQHRISALPVGEQFYQQLAIAADGSLYYMIQPQDGIKTPSGGPNQMTLMRYDFEKREAARVTDGIAGYDLSADGKQLLTFSAPSTLAVGPAAEKFEGKPLALNQVKSFVDPRQEWQQIFDDVWRMQKEYFYAENMHGIDWQAVNDKYAALLPHVKRRADLNTVLVGMISELQVGHNNVGGGDVFRGESDNVGLLGAEFTSVGDRYQISTIYRGDPWSPDLHAPLAAPGLALSEGDFIMAVNGQPITTQRALHAYFVGTAGQAVTLTIADDASGQNAREVTITPTTNDSQLKQWHWIQRNQRYVDEQSEGQIAYVYLPNTTDAGYYFFNRMFFPQANKPALLIDERRNGGGQAANYITELLARPHLSGWYERDAEVWTTPGAAIHGPKTMLIDQDAGSGGDFLPWSFAYLDLGTTIGTRTWGGLIGISHNPDLIDGGRLTVPFFRFFTPEGEWAVENEGVTPDIEVILNPLEVNAGRDPQLERGVRETLRQLQANPPRNYRQAPALPTKVGG